MKDLQAFITQQQSRISELLLNALSGKQLSKHAHASNNRLIEAMHYSLLNGGKRIRPILAFAAANAITTPNNATDTYAAAIECIHAYSLIHDDLPAMDDDDLRRGKPTCHVAFDEATAILAGDALQCFAFELITNNRDIAPVQALDALRVLAKASGAQGMVLGQAIDLASVDKRLPIDQLQNMHAHKTGALIEAAVLLGGISVNACKSELRHLKQYADAIGLAFQVQDDIIDVTSDTATLGKQQGADAERNKPTYVSLLGLEGANDKAQELVDTAINALSPFGEGADYLRQVAHYIIARNH
ncbi:polyprenyl synthetase family protein [Teredinibacter purpureus]|uniref:polyprenyl synthetase family protein n=1 Tax=Teredinibacter purpureus TaxID=2731756 RepID=UPI000696659B|nr:farnesyl diphosphate synthase [Teredinibacter purpureus]